MAFRNRLPTSPSVARWSAASVSVAMVRGSTAKGLDEAVKTIASMAAEINEAAENIGARRLHTVLERLLEELSFSAPDRAGEVIEVGAEMVQERLGDLVGDSDLARYIL